MSREEQEDPSFVITKEEMENIGRLLSQTYEIHRVISYLQYCSEYSERSMRSLEKCERKIKNLTKIKDPKDRDVIKQAVKQEFKELRNRRRSSAMVVTHILPGRNSDEQLLMKLVAAYWEKHLEQQQESNLLVREKNTLLAKAEETRKKRDEAEKYLNDLRINSDVNCAHLPDLGNCLKTLRIDCAQSYVWDLGHQLRINEEKIKTIEEKIKEEEIILKKIEMQEIEKK